MLGQGPCQAVDVMRGDELERLRAFFLWLGIFAVVGVGLFVAGWLAQYWG